MIDSTVLIDAVNRGCEWLAGVSQIREERVPTECARAPRMAQRSWKGAFRGEYSAATRKWDMFCPVWHAGQAVKALCFAHSATGDMKWLASARMAGDFILNQQITDETSAEFGMILAIEDYDTCLNTSAILESLDGLLALYDATGDEVYTRAFIRAVTWVKDNAYMGDGHFLDNYDIAAHAFTQPEWYTRYTPSEGFEKREGRPLPEDAAFLKAYRLTGDESFKRVFYQTVDFLRENDTPPGTWNNYVPCNGRAGITHPRQSFWWGMPMYEAFLDTRDSAYYDCLYRCGEWYLSAQRLDGGMFRNTNLNFDTPCFGVCVSGISCATLLWMRLYSLNGEQRWLEAAERALNFNLRAQFKNASDPNLEGAVLEATALIPGSDASPYQLRDISTVFFIQAAMQYLKQR